MYRKPIIGIVFLILAMFINTAVADHKSSSDSDDRYDKHDRDDRHDRDDDMRDFKRAKLKPSLGPYMTDAGSTVPKPNQTFGWNENPYAFMQFDIDDLNTEKPLFVWWRWRDPDGHVVSVEKEWITNFPEEGNLNLWNSLDNWDVHKQTGEWTVETKWVNPSGGTGRFETSFTVTPVVPEPVSSILFLSGGAVLAIRRYWKRKK